jgi:quercetin dioxygenase-like cupin family protein
MTFHRFEDYEKHYLTPDLSTGLAPVIEGKYMYYCMISKEAGTGSELHYHPNELLIFPVKGKLNALVGKDRRVVEPGMFVHVPAYARHSMKATEEGPVHYLYIKDQTWTVVGLAEDEAVPDKAMSVDEINEAVDSGKGRTRATGKSEAIIEGLNNSFYPILNSLDDAPASARRTIRVDGERLSFTFTEVPPGERDEISDSPHEEFTYMLSGRMSAEVDGEQKEIGPGDIVEVPRGGNCSLIAGNEAPVRHVTISSMPFLEKIIDSKA